MDGTGDGFKVGHEEHLALGEIYLLRPKITITSLPKIVTSPPHPSISTVTIYIFEIQKSRESYIRTESQSQQTRRFRKHNSRRTLVGAELSQRASVC